MKILKTNKLKDITAPDWVLRPLLTANRNVLAEKASSAYCRLFLAFWVLGGFQTALAQGNKPPVDADTTATLTVDLKDNLLSIYAKQTSWRELFNQLNKKTHATFHCAFPLQGSVTASIPPLPIREALERLFGSEADFVFQFAQDDIRHYAMPKEIWVLGNYTTQNPQSAKPSLKIMRDVSHSAPSTQANTDNVLPIVDAFANESIDALTDRAQNDKNPESRIQALANLTGHAETDSSAVNQALETALNDKDASVRGYAVQALANQGSQEAAGQVRLALQDTDIDVRIKAVESVTLNDQGIALLQEALGNPDETVQMIAKDRLNQLSQ